MTPANEWVTVSIKRQLYEQIKQHHVPRRANSVAAYVGFWVRVGHLVDRAIDDAPQEADILDRVVSALKDIERSEVDG